MEIDRDALEAWQRQQPLCVLSLDPADRAVLRVAGKTQKLNIVFHINVPFNISAEMTSRILIGESVYVEIGRVWI